MCLLSRKKKEQIIITRINEIIYNSGYSLVLYKKDYKHFGNCIIKLVCPGKRNIKIITDKNEIIFDNKNYLMEWLGNTKETNKDILILKFIEIIFNVLQSSDWRLAGKECYLFDKLEKINLVEYINSLEHPEMFHEHCVFCWDKVEEMKTMDCYNASDKSYWICNNCYSDFKEVLKFKVNG